MSDLEDAVAYLCNICLTESLCDLVEPINTNCGHLMCWPCLYRAVRDTRQPRCPVCRQQVETVTPLYGMGRDRNNFHVDIPPRPQGPGSFPFESVQLLGDPLRRSARHRTTNRRLTGYDVSNVSGPAIMPRPIDGDPASQSGPDVLGEPAMQPGPAVGGQAIQLGPAVGGQAIQPGPAVGGQAIQPGPALVEAEVGAGRPPQGSRVTEVTGVGTSENRAAASQNQSPEEAEVDFSDDEDEEVRRDALQSDQRVPRFKIKQPVPGCDISHLEAVVLEVEQQIVSNQTKLTHINWSEVARRVRDVYPTSFPGAGNVQKDYKAVSRLSKNGLKKALKNFRAKMNIMNRTGNSGPPDTIMERALRTIITVDQSASEESRRVAPRGRRSRPIISDPQPIVSNSVPEVNRIRSRSPLSTEERGQAESLLNLDTPRAYIQERARLATEGSNLREESLAEMHGRRRGSTASLRAAGSAAILGATATIEAVSSQRINVELMILNNMDIRRQEREEDKEERRRIAASEKEEKERKEKKEKEDKEHREVIEERMMAVEREEKERKDMIFMKLIGVDTKKKGRKSIKVVSVPENPGSQPLPAKLVLTSPQALKEDLCEYMEETTIDGVIVMDEDGEVVLLTNIEELLEGSTEKFKVTMVEKRGKKYFKLVKY